MAKKRHNERPSRSSRAISRSHDVARRFGRALGRILHSPGFWGIALIALIAWLINQQTDYLALSRSWHQRFGLAILLPLASAQAIVSVSPFPGELVAFHNSLVLGFATGAFCNWCGWMLGAALQYKLTDRTASDFGISDLKATGRLPAWLQRVPMDHPAFLICGRWLPFGAHVVNTTAALLKVPLRRYLLYSAVGIIPHAILVAALAQGWILFRDAW